MAGNSVKISNLKLYALTIRMILQSRMSWRLNFLSYLFATTFKEIVQVALIWVVLDRFKSVGGWTVWEVGFLYGLNSFLFRNFTTFLGGCFEITGHVLSGDLDQFLTTPRNPLFLLNARYTSAYRILYNVSALIILLTCGYLAGIAFTIPNLLLLIVFMISGSVILFSVFLITGSLSFWLRDSSELTNFIMNSVVEYLRYPIHIYGKFIAFLLTVIIPIGFVNYFPSAILLGKMSDVLYHPNLGYFAPVVALLTFAAAYLFWLAGLKHYTSTGT